MAKMKNPSYQKNKKTFPSQAFTSTNLLLPESVPPLSKEQLEQVQMHTIYRISQYQTESYTLIYSLIRVFLYTMLYTFLSPFFTSLMGLQLGKRGSLLRGVIDLEGVIEAVELLVLFFLVEPFFWEHTGSSPLIKRGLHLIPESEVKDLDLSQQKLRAIQGQRLDILFHETISTERYNIIMINMFFYGVLAAKLLTFYMVPAFRNEILLIASGARYHLRSMTKWGQRKLLELEEEIYRKLRLDIHLVEQEYRDFFASLGVGFKSTPTKGTCTLTLNECKDPQILNAIASFLMQNNAIVTENNAKKLVFYFNTELGFFPIPYPRERAFVETDSVLKLILTQPEKFHIARDYMFRMQLNNSLLPHAKAFIENYQVQQKNILEMSRNMQSLMVRVSSYAQVPSPLEAPVIEEVSARFIIKKSYVNIVAWSEFYNLLKNSFEDVVLNQEQTEIQILGVSQVDFDNLHQQIEQLKIQQSSCSSSASQHATASFDFDVDGSDDDESSDLAISNIKVTGFNAKHKSRATVTFPRTVVAEIERALTSDISGKNKKKHLFFRQVASGKMPCTLHPHSVASAVEYKKRRATLRMDWNGGSNDAPQLSVTSVKINSLP